MNLVTVRTILGTLALATATTPCGCPGKPISNQTSVEQQARALPPESDKRKYTFGEAMDIINENLKRQGQYIIRHQNKLRVISLNDSPGPIPRIHSERLESRDPDEMVQVLLSVKNRSAEVAVRDIESLEGNAGKIIALNNVNKILVSDKVSNILLMKQRLGQLGK